uniref:Cadherin domain-containing protein n=1 Tax=Aquila chrysaetos chrysaetos TaxID=223781 RepID=A0A663EX87_AQUCH
MEGNSCSVSSRTIESWFLEEKPSKPLSLTIVDGEKLPMLPQSFYSLVVQVHDMAPLPASRYTSTAQVSIILLDVNDSPPSFISPKLTYVPENTPIDTIVFKAQATDPDSGPNSYIEYSLLRPLGNKFSIGTIDGEVRLTGELDREAMSNYTLTVVATDKGQPSLSSSTDVVVIVLDINDNNPLFAQKLYKVEVGENTLTGTDLIQVFATDGDEGTNGQVRYAIVSGDANNEFRIDSVTGVITVAKPLDREKKPSYTLTVQSADRTPLQSTTVKVIINILDENDNAPRFSQIFSASVPENAPLGFTVTRVTTSDEDIGVNAVSRYTIRDTSLPFTINPSTGDITISRPLNREDTDRYRIRVSAHDSGWTVSTDVTIFVTDVNDNAPRFTKPSYYLECPELPGIGLKVTQVSATDPDEGSNGQVFYFIKSQSEFFRINATTGEIFNKQYLRYQNSSGSIVTATDGGWVSRTGYCSVTVNVIDVNDNSPAFSPEDYFPNVLENAPSGTTVIRLNATDADSGPNAVIAYAIQSSDSDLF